MVDVPDPRVVVQDMGFRGVDNVTESWFPVDKGNREDAPTRMASWAEAQLIIAEARLGNIAVERINAVRKLHDPDFPDYQPVDVNNDEEVFLQVIEERRREFWLEGRWLNDMIRHRDTGHEIFVFNEGLHHAGTFTYHPVYCFPLPAAEVENNPNVEETGVS